MPPIPDPDPRTPVVPLHEEALSVTRRPVAGSTVRVATVTHEREHLVDEALTHERVEIERVPIGRTVEAVPPIREEGDTTIMPVVEEVVVIERRLVLKEEIRIRRVRSTEHHRETVVLRTQDAVITRDEAGVHTAGDETVRVDPRPVAGGRTANVGDFTDRTIEMTETGEEAVVGKTARVVEEISLHKEGTDRTETVRDTVRRQEVEIEEVPGAETSKQPR